MLYGDGWLLFFVGCCFMEHIGAEKGSTTGPASCDIEQWEWFYGRKEIPSCRKWLTLWDLLWVSQTKRSNSIRDLWSLWSQDQSCSTFLCHTGPLHYCTALLCSCLRSSREGRGGLGLTTGTRTRGARGATGGAGCLGFPSEMPSEKRWKTTKLALGPLPVLQLLVLLLLHLLVLQLLVQLLVSVPGAKLHNMGPQPVAFHPKEAPNRGPTWLRW